MPFPQFDAHKRKILFFSRGRGRGHAVPDVQLATELLAAVPDLQIRFVSYGAGARTIEELGQPVIDLQLVEEWNIAETTVLAGRLIGSLQPDLVISHEEFAPLPAAKIFHKPAVAIIDWFSDPGRYSMASLAFADTIIFPDQPGTWDEPSCISGKVHYTAPLLRRFTYHREDRARARVELDIPAEAVVISVLPGSWTEQQSALLHRMSEAFQALPFADKYLIWLAGDDFELIGGHFSSASNVRVLRRDWQIDRLMAASDAAVTKCNRFTLLELEHLEVPSLSVAYGHNPIDERRAGTLSMTRVIGLDNSLADRLRDLVSNPPHRIHPPAPLPSAVSILARVAQALNLPRPGSSGHP